MPSSPTARRLARSSATAAPDRPPEAVTTPASQPDDEPLAGGAPPACARCGGPLVSGALVMPILGRAKFAYNLRGRSIETDVDAQMCSDCGLLTFTAEDPQRIRRARDADRYAAAARDGSLRRMTRGRPPRSAP